MLDKRERWEKIYTARVLLFFVEDENIRERNQKQKCTSCCIEKKKKKKAIRFLFYWLVKKKSINRKHFNVELCIGTRYCFTFNCWTLFFVLVEVEIHLKVIKLYIRIFDYFSIESCAFF